MPKATKRPDRRFTDSELADIATCAAKGYAAKVSERFKRSIDHAEFTGDAYAGAVLGNNTYNPKRGRMSRRSYCMCKATQAILDYQRSRANNWMKAKRKLRDEPTDMGFLKAKPASAGTPCEIDPLDVEGLMRKLAAIVGDREALVYRLVKQGRTYVEAARIVSTRAGQSQMKVPRSEAWVSLVVQRCDPIMRVFVADYLSDAAGENRQPGGLDSAGRGLDRVQSEPGHGEPEGRGACPADTSPQREAVADPRAGTGKARGARGSRSGSGKPVR